MSHRVPPRMWRPPWWMHGLRTNSNWAGWNVVLRALGGSPRWQWCQLECHSGQHKHIFSAWEVEDEMARQRDSPKAFIIKYCTWKYADIHVTEEPECVIPDVVLVMFVVVRSGKWRRAGRRLNGQSSLPLPCTSLHWESGKMKAARLRQLSQNIWSTYAGTQDENVATAPEGTR